MSFFLPCKKYFKLIYLCVYDDKVDPPVLGNKYLTLICLGSENYVLVWGGGILGPQYILKNHDPSINLYRHVIHVYISEFHGESNGGCPKALRPLLHELGDHLQQQHGEGHRS